MNCAIRQVTAADVDAVTRLEAKCFPPHEAPGREVFARRIAAFGDSFFVAEQDGEILGMINGCVTDQPRILDAMYQDESLHRPEGAYQTVFGLAVDPDFRRQGITSQLMRYFIQLAKERGKAGLVLTCSLDKIPFYERYGYENEGCFKTDSDGDWYRMVLRF